MPDRLAALLERSRGLGFLGPGDPAGHRAHAAAFVSAWAAHRPSPPASLCDLGTGGGVPGLVLATIWPSTRTVLLEAAERRCAFLTEAIEVLELTGHVSVAHGRAEALARTAALDGRFELVTARSFGRPATTAECAARLLAHGGILLVAEPPDDEPVSRRWPLEGLAALGLGNPVACSTTRRLVRIERLAPCPDRFPRRTGVPTKRPLF